MVSLINSAGQDESYKGKTVTEATYEEEEGEFASSDSPTSKRFGGRSGNKNYLYIAPLPSFCKVNPNLPHSDSNQKETIVSGIERVSEGAEDAKSISNGPSDKGKRYRLSDFEKIEKIGEGTFGKVYRAEYRDPDTG